VINYTKKLDMAIRRAAWAHGKQKQYRSGTDIPYIIHPFGVMTIASNYTEDEDVLIGCLMHDILEDVSPELYDENDMRLEFGEEIVAVVKDVTKWRDYVKAPKLDYPDEAWATAIAEANAIDRNEQYVTVFVAPGLFEHVHYLMSMEEALMAYYEEPEAMHELIDYLVDFELRLAEEFIKHLHPDAVFHHDDWGSQINSFISPAMFKEFFEPAYKKIYGYYKENGVELIIHHSDSYAANLVPSMIEMGIDIWQGVMNTNNIPELIKQYGDKITFMGGIHSGLVDFPGWTPEIVAEYVRKTCEENGKLYFIPCQTSGLPIESFPGVYQTITQEIDKMSAEMF